jgi:AcrR family transcriptional regulator
VPRPPFEPDDQQQKVLRALASLAEQRRIIDTETDKLMAEAERLNIPIDRIAKEVKVTRKTVYRHLGKPMK